MSGSFQLQSGFARRDPSSVHLAARHSLHPSYMQTAQPAPFEGIVDFSYSQPQSFVDQFSPSADAAIHEYPAVAHRQDTSEWKQSSFFSYRPNEVKHRKRTTRQQLKVLEETFRTTQKPDGNVRKTLAAQLNMTPRNVQVWFQNRRAKDKTLAKRAQKAVEDTTGQEATLASAPAFDSEITGHFDSAASVHQAVETYSPQIGGSPDREYQYPLVASSGSASPVEAAYTARYEVPTPVAAIQETSPHSVSPTVSAFSQDNGLSAHHSQSSFSDMQTYGAPLVSQAPMGYARDAYAPRASLPHIHAAPFQPDSQHQRSNSSPSFPSSMSPTSNLSLTTYASINGVLYPHYGSASTAGPLPAADFTFGMPARTEVDGYRQYSSVSGSDTPSSLSHYGSVASLADSDALSSSAQSFEEEAAPLGWNGEQRRGSIPLAVRQPFINPVKRGFSPLSVGYASNSPRPGTAPSTDPESESAEHAMYMTARSEWPIPLDHKPFQKVETVEQSSVFGYQPGPFVFGALAEQDNAPGAYGSYVSYGQQQQPIADAVVNFGYPQADASDRHIAQPTPTYGNYTFA